MIDEGNSNSVTRMNIRDNVGLSNNVSADLGDGIAVFDSASNRITDNVVMGNGLYDGIAILGPAADGNLVRGNTVSGNVGLGWGDTGFGIVVNAAGLGPSEGVISDTRIEENIVKNNAGNGIDLFNTVGTRILGNVVSGNGFEPGSFFGSGVAINFGHFDQARPGDTSALVRDNEIHGNAASGVVIGSGATGNRIVGNDAADNNVIPFVQFGEPAFDLYDQNAGCAGNVWRAKTWGSGYFNPVCTTVGGTGPVPPPASAARTAPPGATARVSRPARTVADPG